MPKRAWEWSKRVMWGEGRHVPLGVGQELWNWNVSLYECAEGIRAALTRAGKQPDDDSIIFEATDSLIRDVIDAAGGIEQAHQRFRQAADLVQNTYARWANELGPLPEGGGMIDVSVEMAWYAIEEMLVWARVLDDRLKRKPVNRQYQADQGLIPALADGPCRYALIRARSRLLQGGVLEARYLVGLSLHMQSSQAGSKSGRIRSSEVVLPFPDHVTEPVSHRWQLTYINDRDAASVADNLWAATDRFMDEMLLAFEMNVPERFKQQ